MNKIDNNALIYFIAHAGIVEHIHFTVVDCVLPSVGRNYSSDVASCPIAGEICAVYNDIRHV